MLRSLVGSEMCIRDRYILKLFRDFVFHQVTEDGRPFLDMSHVIHALNRLDAGSPDKVTLVSRDEQNVLVVSFTAVSYTHLTLPTKA